MARKIVVVFFLLFSSILLPSGAKADAFYACGHSISVPESLMGRVTAICGVNQPEDFDVTPDGRHIIVGDLGMELSPQGNHFTQKAAEMSVIDTATGKLSQLRRTEAGKADWGDRDCRKRDPKGAFFVIGMNIAMRSPGVVQLATINSVGGDHIDLFELKEQAGELTAAWRGCIEAPSDGTVDAVAALPDGGFVASIICGGEVKALPTCFSAGKAKHATGWLFIWTPKNGAVRLPNSEASQNNGLQVSDDGQEVYAVASGTRQLKVYSLAEHRYTKSIDLPFTPDNAKRGPDGSITVGGTTNGIVCLGKAGCTNTTWAMAVQPRSGRRELLLYADDGLLSGTTGGVVTDHDLYLSSMTDPFILKVRQEH
jgi:hypothetical protein